MRTTRKTQGKDDLSDEEQLSMAEELWETAAQDLDGLPLPTAQRNELDRRLEDDEANPDDLVDWAEVQAQVEAVLHA